MLLRKYTSGPASTAMERLVVEKLQKALQPSALKVRDVSGGCGSMFSIFVQSEKFAGLNTMRQHRMVNEILADEIRSWHGLQLVTKAK